MEDINSPKLKGEQVANQLIEKLKSGLFKKLSDHELDVFKQHMANGLNLVQDGPPSNMNEGALSPNYWGTLRPEGNWNDEVAIEVYKSPEDEYSLGLNVYSTDGRGMAAVTNLRLGNAAVSLDQITPKYVIGEVSKIYDLKDSDKEELVNFVNNIPSQIETLKKKKGGSSIKERLKTMIRKELMGDRDEEVLRDKYLYKLNAYKNMKKNNRSNFEIDQARKELVDAAKAYGIDLPA